MEFLHAAAAALGLGIWTALQPCPMATNLAALAYLGRRVDRPWRVALAGILYAAGNALTYIVLAIVLLGGAASDSAVSTFLQRHVVQILGPLFVLLGMVLLELLTLRLPAAMAGPSMVRRIDAWGLWAALPLGVVLALAFCPVSAAYFFVSLLTMLAEYHSRIVLPLVYGLGTALPVMVFAVLLAVSVRRVGTAFDRLRQVEGVVRRAAGVLLVALGIHYSLKYDFEIVPFWDRWLESLATVWSTLLHGGHR